MKSAASRLALGVAVGALGLLVAGGATARQAAAPVGGGPAADYPMVLGTPFTVEGVTYTPADTMNYDAVGYAVADAEGGGAISGAHRTLPLPCYVEVTALDSGRTVLVRLERRGPMTGDALVALSPGARAQLGLSGAHDAVRVRRVNPPEPERALLRTGQPVPPRMDTPPGLLTALKRKLGVLPAVQPDPQALAAALAASRAGTTPAYPAPRPVATAPGMVKPPAPKPVVAKPPVPVASAPKPVVAAVAKPQPKAPQPKAPDVKKPEAKKPEPKKPEAGASAPKPASGPAYLVQVGAFSTRANAEKAAKQVGGQVVPAGKFFRVHIGPTAGEAAAQAALAKAKRAGYADARVQRAP